MKTLHCILSLITLATVSVACQKKEEKKNPVRTYTVTIAMQPTNNDYTALDDNKNVFLSLENGSIYNTKTAPANASSIHLVVYDGSTSSSSIGDIHFVSPGGGTLSMHTAPTIYLYRDLGSINNSTQFFTLTSMNSWSKYNETKIRDESGMNGLTLSDFDNIEYVDAYQAAINKIKQPGTDNSNYAKKLLTISNSTLKSKIWYFEFVQDGVTKTALAKLSNFQYMPDGFITMQVKLLN